MNHQVSTTEKQKEENKRTDRTERKQWHRPALTLIKIKQTMGGSP